MITKRVDLDAGDTFRVTPMHLASICNHCGIVSALLRSRANVSPSDVEGDMPIHWAATKGHAEVRRMAITGARMQHDLCALCMQKQGTKQAL
jgi:ankyrin repeat protein